MPHEIQMLLRENVMNRIDPVLGDLPLQNNYEEVFDRGISKGTTNWQVFGSRKPGNESYALIKYWDVSFDEDRELEIEEHDLNKPEKDFYLKLIPIISARNENALSVSFKKVALEKCKNSKSFKKSKRLLLEGKDLLTKAPRLLTEGEKWSLEHEKDIRLSRSFYAHRTTRRRWRDIRLPQLWKTLRAYTCSAATP